MSFSRGSTRVVHTKDPDPSTSRVSSISSQAFPHSLRASVASSRQASVASSRGGGIDSSSIADEAEQGHTPKRSWSSKIKSLMPSNSVKASEGSKISAKTSKVSLRNDMNDTPETPLSRRRTGSVSVKESLTKLGSMLSIKKRTPSTVCDGQQTFVGTKTELASNSSLSNNTKRLTPKEESLSGQQSKASKEDSNDIMDIVSETKPFDTDTDPDEESLPVPLANHLMHLGHLNPIEESKISLPEVTLETGWGDPKPAAFLGQSTSEGNTISQDAIKHGSDEEVDPEMAAYIAMSGDLPPPISCTSLKTRSPPKTMFTSFTDSKTGASTSANSVEYATQEGIDPEMVAYVAISDDLPQLTIQTSSKTNAVKIISAASPPKAIVTDFNNSTSTSASVNSREPASDEDRDPEMAAYRAMSGELPQPSSRTRSKTSPIVTPLSPSKSTVTAFHETTLDVPASANDEEIDPDPGADVDPGMTACLAISNDLPQLAAHTYPKQVTISTRSPLKSHSTSLSSSQEKILLTEAASGDAGSNSTAMPIRTGPKTTAVKSGPQSAKSSLVYIASSSPRVVKSSDSVFDPAATGFKTIDGRRASIASKRTTTSSASLKSPGAGSSQNSGGRVSNVTSRSRIPTPSKKASEAGNETSATASQQASREHSQKSSVMSRHDPRNKGSSPAPGYMNGSIHDVLGPLSDENGAQEKYKVIQSDSASLDSEKRGKCSSNNRIFGKLELEIETDETDPATAIGSETFPNCEPSQRLMTASRNLNIFQKVSTESNEFVGPDTAALPDFNESIILKTATIPATIHKERLQPESKHVQPAPLLSEPQMAGHLNHDGSMFIPISAYRTGSESTSATQSLERLKQIEVQFKGSTRRCSFNTTSIVNARPLRGANIKNSTDKLNEVKAVAESIGSLHATVAKINTSTGGSYHNLSPKFHHSHVSVSRSLSSENFKSAPHSGSTKTSKSNFIEVEQGGGSLNETINTLTTAKTESPTPKHTQSATYSGSVQAAINSLSSAEKKSTDSRIMQTTSNINDSTQNITSKLQGRNSRNGAKAVSKSSIIETISRLSKPKSSPVTPKYNSRSNVVVSVSNNSNNNASHRRSTGNMTKSSGKLELNAVKATKVPEILTSRQPSARPDKASSVEMIKSQSRSTNSAESKADSVTVDQFVSRESHQPSQNEFGKPSGKPNDSDAESFCSVTSRELGLTGLPFQSKVVKPPGLKSKLGGEVPSASGEHLGNSNLKNAETVFKHFLDLDDMKTVQNSNNNLANQQQQRSNQLLIHDYMAPITTHSSEPQKADSASVFKHYMDLDEMKAQPTRTSWQALSPHKKQTPKSSRQGIVSKPTHPQKADTASVFKHYMDVDEMKERSAQSSSYALSSQKRTPKLNRSGSLNPTPKNSGQKNNASMFKHYMDLDEMKGSSSRNSEQSLAAQSRKSSTIGGNSTPEHSISMQTKRVQKADNASVASHYLDLDDMKETIFRNGARTISTHIPKPQAESNKKGIRSTQTTPTHKVHDQKDDTASVFKHFMDLDETREASVRSSVNNFRSKENAGIQPNFINKHPDLLATREDFVVHKVPSRASFSANEDDEEFSSCLDFPQSQLDALKSSMKTFLAEDLVNFSHHQNETSKRAVDAPFKSTPSLTGASSSSPIPDEKPNSFTPDPRRVVEAMISNLYAALRPYLKEADWARAMAAQTLSNQLHKELAYLFVDQVSGSPRVSTSQYSATRVSEGSKAPMKIPDFYSSVGDVSLSNQPAPNQKTLPFYASVESIGRRSVGVPPMKSLVDYANSSEYSPSTSKTNMTMSNFYSSISDISKGAQNQPTDRNETPSSPRQLTLQKTYVTYSPLPSRSQIRNAKAALATATNSMPTRKRSQDYDKPWRSNAMLGTDKISLARQSPTESNNESTIPRIIHKDKGSRKKYYLAKIQGIGKQESASSFSSFNSNKSNVSLIASKGSSYWSRRSSSSPTQQIQDPRTTSPSMSHLPSYMKPTLSSQIKGNGGISLDVL